jgi:flagellar hook-associated protein 2
MASGTLAVGGLMSGIDTESMFAQLREAYRKPIELMETRKEDYNVKLSAYSTLQAKLSALRAAAKEMDTSSEFASLSASSSDEDVFTATTISTAKDMTYNMQVKALAQTHKVATARTYSSTETFGDGDLTIQVGNNTARTITLDSSDTIQDIADEINNDSSMDVVAATVFDGDKYRLMISAKESGDENIVNITVKEFTYDVGGNREYSADDANIDSSGLSQLAYDNFKTETATVYDTFTGGRIEINADTSQGFSVLIDSGDTMQDIVDKINNSDYWYETDGSAKLSDEDIASVTSPPKAVLVNDFTDSGKVFIRADGVDSWDASTATKDDGGGPETATELLIDNTFMLNNMYYQTNGSADPANDTFSGTIDFNQDENDGTVHENYNFGAASTYSQIADTINTVHTGITASTIEETSTGHLFLRFTGISAGDDGAPDINSSIVTIGDGTMFVNSRNMTRSQYGQDATVVIDGTTIKRDSNSIDDMLTGVTLNLKTTSYNSTSSSYDTLTLDVARDSSAMIEKFETLAEAYNDLVDFFEEYQGVQLKEDESSKSLEDGMMDLISILSGDELDKDEDDSPIQYGPLMGDSTTSMIKSKLFNVSFSDVSGVNSSYNNLTEMGISLNYGKMSIDKDKFSAAVSADADAVNEFFTNDSTTSQGFAVQLIDAIDNMIENYASDQKGILLARQDGLQSTIDRLDEQIASQEDRINSVMERTRAQFNSLEVLMGQYQTTSSYLASQLASMAG